MEANFVMSSIAPKAAPKEVKKDRRDKYKMGNKKAQPDRRPLRDISVE